jgi:hypothetical protein
MVLGGSWAPFIVAFIAVSPARLQDSTAPPRQSRKYHAPAGRWEKKTQNDGRLPPRDIFSPSSRAA